MNVLSLPIPKDAAVRLAAGGTRPGADALAGIVALVRDLAGAVL